jgi:hypothetical protein
MRRALFVSLHPAWLYEVWAGQSNGYSSSSELIVIGDGAWMRAPPAATWDALAAARTDPPTPLFGLPTSAVLSAPSA